MVSFDDSALSVSMPKPSMVSLSMDYPKIETVRSFQKDQAIFNSEIRKLFNQAMEAQKWVSDREGVSPVSTGYWNVETNPEDVEFSDFVLDPKPIKEYEVEATLGQSFSIGKTFMDLAEEMRPEDLGKFIKKVYDSIKKIRSALFYLTGASGATESEQISLAGKTRKHLEDSWDCHNAHMIYTVGYFAHSNEFDTNYNNVLDIIENAINAKEDLAEDDPIKKRFKECKEFGEWLAANKFSDPNDNSVLHKMAKDSHKKFEQQEFTRLGSVSCANMSFSRQHHFQVERYEEELKSAQVQDAQLKASMMKAIKKEEAERKANLMKSAEKSKAANNVKSKG
ncbi:MAG: hypothetical protein WCV91_00835 [Candidatus Margulisiibacteriota bacterium]